MTYVLAVLLTAVLAACFGLMHRGKEARGCHSCKVADGCGECETCAAAFVREPAIRGDGQGCEPITETS